MINSVILFVFLITLGILLFNFKILKSEKKWHEQIVLNYEKQIESQFLKKIKLNNFNHSNIVFQQLDVIKQQIALLEVISNINPKEQ